MDNIKCNLKGVVGSKKNGLLLTRVQEEYFNVTHSQLDYWNYGFSSVRDLLESIPDIVRIVKQEGQLVVIMVLTKNDPNTLRDLAGLINKTKMKKEKCHKPGGVRLQNYSKNSVPYQNYSKSILPLESFKISVRNDRCNESSSYVSKEIAPEKMKNEGNIPRMNSMNSKESINSTNYGFHSIVRDEMHLLKDKPPSAHNSSLSSFLTCSTPSPQNEIPSPLENGSYMPMSNGNAKTCDESLDDSIVWALWFIRPKITFNVFQKQVKVLGVQSGHAIVMKADYILTRHLVKTKNISTKSIFPGDIFMWQPPFEDPRRPMGYVDIGTAFPVTFIKRCDNSRVYVRIMGLFIQLSVITSDLYEMPPCSKDLLAITRSVQNRDITIVSLAVTHPNFDLWDDADHSDIYRVILVPDEEVVLLEKTSDRGVFLNILYLSNMQEKMSLAISSVDEKTTFMRLLLIWLDQAKNAILQTYLKLRTDHELYTTECPLRLIYSVNECDQKVLVGSQSILSKDILHFSKRDELLRLKYWENKHCFYNMDVDDSHDIMIPDQRPLVGVYIVNTDFVRSSTTSNDILRFRTSLVASLPSIVDVALKLGLCNL